MRDLKVSFLDLEQLLAYSLFSAFFPLVVNVQSAVAVCRLRVEYSLFTAL